MFKYVVITVVAACVCACAPGVARAADCRRADAVFYSTDSVRLAQRLHADQSACADYYISVTPGGADGTTIRTGVAGTIHQQGPQFHAMAEIRFSAASWGSWVVANNKTWFDAGVEARRRMALAGYDTAHDDMWALNELSPDVIAGNGTARTDVLEFMRGLYTGNGTPMRGTVFVTVPLHVTTDLASYKSQLQAWLADSAFWNTMSQYVRFFGDETYADSRTTLVPGSDLATRAGYLDDYFQHVPRLVAAGPDRIAAARSFLANTFLPIANAAWPFSSSFGFTDIAADQMENFVSTQTYAERAASTAERDRMGFAWVPKSGFGGAVSLPILDRLAGALHRSDAGADGACTDAAGNWWCDTSVDGGAFDDAWKTFVAWTPVTNTPDGTAVHVDAAPGVSVTFAVVSTSGNTSATAPDTTADPPVGYHRAAGAPSWTIGTDAAYSGPVDVCVAYGGADYLGLTPRLAALVAGGWQDATTTLDRAAQTVCGRIAALTQVAVFGADPPTLVVPSSITVDGAGTAGAVVSFAATATSPFDPAPVVACTPPSGSAFVYGTTHVLCTATDSGGGTSNGGFEVTVLDVTPPTLTVPAPIVANATSPAGAVVEFAAAATDNADAAPTVTCSPASGSMFAIGTTTIVCSATDSSGNRATGTLDVTVKGPREQLHDLSAAVASSLALSTPTRSALLARLDNALRQLDSASQNATRNACNSLDGFLELLRTPNAPANAVPLVADATRIGAVLAC